MSSESPYPLFFRPLIKQTIWGGSKLGSLLGKQIADENNYAESWEIVDHGEDQSVVLNGPHAGKTLHELIRQDRRGILGSDSEESIFPLLLKYLDCNRVLSVQVHPDDEYAATMLVPDRGKTEAWYVVDAAPDSLIYAGLKKGVDRQTLAQAVSVGETESVLHSFHPSPGDTVFIPAGTVHALGEGLVIAEIQQSSNTTFRLFDWNRVDANGNARPLHVEESLAVSDYQSGPVHARQSDRTVNGLQLLVRCDKFTLAALERGEAEIAKDDQFEIVTVPRGNATLTLGKEEVSLKTGQSLLLPAALPACTIAAHEDSTVLVASGG